MSKPDKIKFPHGMATPPGYINVTCFQDQEQSALPGPDHIWYRYRDRIAEVLQQHGHERNAALAIAEQILEIETV